MKLAPRRYGPFKVAAKISDIAYRLELPDVWKIHNVFHASLLMPYKETDKHGPNFLEPPPDLINGEEEWEIEKILGHQTYRKRKQYLIRWKGYMPAHDSWTDESGLHAPELLADYKQQLVRQILINLIRSTAEIPHDQSALSRHWESTHIRTLRTEDKEAFPTSPHTGPSQRTHILQEPIPSSLLRSVLNFHLLHPT